MPAELLSVVETARDFLQKSGHQFVRLESTSFDTELNEWHLVFDVGISTPNLKRVVVDGATEKVVRLDDLESPF